MRNARMIVSIIIGLLTALTTTYSAAQSTPSIVGTWETTVAPAGGTPSTPFQSMLTFFADGNVVEVNAGNPAVTAPGRGVWTGSGNAYLMTFNLFSFDEKGKNTGKIKSYLSISMAGLNRFTCTFTADAIDLTGKVTKRWPLVLAKAPGSRLGNPERFCCGSRPILHPFPIGQE
jgi:hypothetical protein